MATLLLGLRPPSNVERILNRAKQLLFESFASVSAVALGPVIPLCYGSSPVEPPSALTLPHGIELATGEWTLTNGALMLGVEPADRLARLAGSLSDDPSGNAVTEGPLPLFPGIYIASTTEAALRSSWPTAEPQQPFGANDMLLALGPAPRLKWSTSELVSWRIELRFPQRWWDDVKCEELWHVRLRKGGSRAG